MYLIWERRGTQQGERERVCSKLQSIMSSSICVLLSLFIFRKKKKTQNLCYVLWVIKKNIREIKTQIHAKVPPSFVKLTYGVYIYNVKWKRRGITWFLDKPVCRAKRCLSASLGYLRNRPEKDIRLHLPYKETHRCPLFFLPYMGVRI